MGLPAWAADWPVGNWNIKVKVGHVGEGIRMVVLHIKETDGKPEVKMSKLNGQLDDVDEVAYENGILTVVQGSYEYTLTFEGDAVKGKVVSPAGEQEVTGKRQASIRLQGDETEPLRRSWRGKIERRDDQPFIKTGQGYELFFSNAEEFKDDLAKYAGKDTTVTLTGWWIKTKIKIQSVEPVAPSGP
jgi:hypothetical protein